MANSMKKFKLLHNMTSVATATTTTSTHRTPTTPSTLSPIPNYGPAAQYHTTPSHSPAAATTGTSKHVRTSSASYAAQSDARRQTISFQQQQQQRALEQIAQYQQSLHASIQQATFSLPFTQQLIPETLQVPAQRPVLATSKCSLPGGFLTLAPEDPYPGVCVQNEFYTQQPSFHTSFNFTTVNPVTLPPTTSKPARPQLSAANIAKIDASDSRQFRWDRVLRYVGSVRRHAAAPTSSYIASQRLYIQRTPADDSNSLWDGGSCGTDGVDEFVWDDEVTNGQRFTLPPTCPPILDQHQTMMFRMEDTFDTDEQRPAKRSKSAERAATASSAMPQYLQQPMYSFGEGMGGMPQAISGFA